MKGILLFFVFLAATSTLTGCVSEEQRLANCESKGISRDMCYQMDRQHQDMLISNGQNAAYNANNNRTLAKDLGKELNKKHH